MVMTDFFENLNYDAKEIKLKRKNICGDRTHQKLGGHILPKRIRQLFPCYGVVMSLVTIWSNFMTTS